jgi:RNA polymerase sigma-70 factor, ECF subfamily
MSLALASVVFTEAALPAEVRSMLRETAAAGRPTDSRAWRPLWERAEVAVSRSLYWVQLIHEVAGSLQMRSTPAASTDDTGATLGDAELVAAWCGGDEPAAAELVRRHSRPLARFLAAAGARDDLEDLVQETFLRAFRRAGSFRGEAEFRSWLFAIGSNALRDLGRRQGRSPFVPAAADEEFADSSMAPDGLAEGDQALDRLSAAVYDLPRMQREVFLMRAQQDLEYAGIAAALETTVGSARVHYHQAVKRLKEILG